ncbi:MAG: glucose-6-phosphate dehydrogenase [Pyrinomonadaceae bacterium]
MSTTLEANATEDQSQTAAQLPRADSCVVVIFGASGDLSKRKLMPALFNLACEGCTGRRFEVLGVGRTPLTDEEFRSQMREAVSKAKDTRDFNEAQWQDLEPRLSYMIGDPNDNNIQEELAERLGQMAAGGSSPNRLFYLSVPPSVTQTVIEGLGSAGLAAQENGWSRIIVEKPFGRDLDSARALNGVINRVFRESQVYRIDHFLGKDTVQNIFVFRFGNSLFEPIWNRNYIDYVEITGAETLGVGGRAGYYEEAGALRDMVANHLLQILTLTAMEPPVAFDADAVREEKVKVLRAIRPMSPEEVKLRAVRGQYGPGHMDGQPVPGYRQEPGVPAASAIDTYAAIEFRIENWRWAGVPFYVRTGKRLARTATEVAVHLKRTPQALFRARRPTAWNRTSLCCACSRTKASRWPSSPSAPA